MCINEVVSKNFANGIDLVNSSRTNHEAMIVLIYFILFWE